MTQLHRILTGLLFTQTQPFTTNTLPTGSYVQLTKGTHVKLLNNHIIVESRLLIILFLEMFSPPMTEAKYIHVSQQQLVTDKQRCGLWLKEERE